MRTLWSLLLAGRVGAPLERNDLYRWRRKLHRDGFGCGLHAALRAALTPRIKVSKPAYWPEELASGKRLERISDLAQWEIVLSAPHVHAAVVDLGNDVEWRLLLPELLPDFAALLKDALDLQKELGGIESMSDRSYVDQPSISHHPQNRRFHDWTALIELTRDAWLATATVTPERARHIAQHWSQTPYPLFRRLAFFAAAQPGVVPAQQGLDWLLADDCRWLWSMETQREAIRLMVALAVSGHSQVLAELDHAILDGPPAGYFSGGPEPDSLQRHIDWMVWLRLSKIDHAGAMLSGTAQLVLSTLSAKHPDLMLADDESDEFPFWMARIHSNAAASPRTGRIPQDPSLHRSLVWRRLGYALPKGLRHNRSYTLRIGATRRVARVTLAVCNASMARPEACQTRLAADGTRPCTGAR
jgi:hypothetical protein